MARTLSKTKKELLENTISRYNLNNRAVNNMGGCYYITKDGKRCAIGIEVNKGLAKHLNQLGDGFGTGVSKSEVFEALPNRLKKMGQFFLHSIQWLHDNEANWDEKGLTKAGKIQVQEIREEFIYD